MQANKPESCPLSAQNSPGSHEKTIPICGKPRRHEGFGIHCRILCIIKNPPNRPAAPLPRRTRALFRLLCRSDSRCLLQHLDPIRAEPGSPSDSEDTTVTPLGFLHFHISDWLAENYDPSVRKSTSGSRWVLPAAIGQNSALLERE